jgi:hypothetical protein
MRCMMNHAVQRAQVVTLNPNLHFCPNISGAEALYDEEGRALRNISPARTRIRYSLEVWRLFYQADVD